MHDQYSEAAILYPQALGLYGSWLAETRSENPNKIIEEYLEKVWYVTTSHLLWEKTEMPDKKRNEAKQRKIKQNKTH